MKKKKIIFILSVIVLMEIICIAGLCMCTGQENNTTNVVIREIPQQTVLYKIYRGSYYKLNDAIDELYTLANSKGIRPCGKLSTCCLNSPIIEDSNHVVIEIQIPVENSAIEQAGTLGDMTDIKILPPVKVAVAVKPEGCNDPSLVIKNLFSWVNKNGYIVMGKMRQSVLDGQKGNYQKLRTEFLLPVDEIHYKNRVTMEMDPCYM